MKTESLCVECLAGKLPYYVFCICLLTNKYQKYKAVELGDQLMSGWPDIDNNCPIDNN